MKRFLSVFLTIAMVASMLGGMAVFAEPVTTEVIADEGWENATYDAETGIITDVDAGYSLKITGTAIGPVADQNITAEKVVIPSGIKTEGGVLSIKSVTSGVLVGAAFTKATSSPTNESVKEIVISEGITTIDKYAFENSKALTTITIPSTVTSINEYAFYSCSALTGVEFPEGIVNIKKGAFQYCKALTEVTIPESVTKFGGSEVFRGCTLLAKVNLSSTMTETNSGGGVFRETALTEITFPATLAKIYKNDFYKCTALKSVTFTQPTAPSVNSASFSGCSGMTVTIPGESEGYDDTWKALFPSGTTFVYTPGRPKASGVALDGLNLIGDTLTATYTYFDPASREESGSTTVWEACANADFAEGVTVLETDDCSEAAPATFTITNDHDGLYIRATVIARNADTELNEGKPVSVQLENAVRVPVTVPTVAINNYKADEEIAINKEVLVVADATCDNTTITKVEFFAGETSLGVAEAAPYQVSWTPTEEGKVALTAVAHNALGESNTSAAINVVVVGKIPIYTIKTSGPDNWGTFNGTTATKTPGAGEDGVTSVWVLTGGSNGGGGSFSLNVGNFAASTITHKDKYGNTLGKTKGLIDASEFWLRYKSDKSFKIKFRLEYRASKKPTKTSAAVTVPATNGEWSTFKIPMSEFRPGDTVEDLWVHNICGAYTSNFDPVVLMRVEGLNLGSSGQMVLDSIGANWYEDEMVTDVKWLGTPKTTYFQYYDNYDYTSGQLAVYRGNSEEPAEILPLSHPLVTVKGFSNTTIKDNATESKNLKLTVTAYGKDLVYYARVIPFAPETLTSIQINEPKTEYFVGDPFDYDTGLIQANYSDKDPEFARFDDKNALVEGFDSSTEGEKTITVTYGGQTTTYTINVTTYKVQGVTSIKVNNPRKIYTVGESFNYHDGNVTAYNGDSLVETLKLYNRYIQITGFDTSAPVEDQEVTVSYSGITTTFTIDVLEDQAPTAYYNILDMTEKNRPSIWYPTSGGTVVEGEGIDGVKPALKFTGSATYQCALTGGWAGGNSTTNIGTTVSGLKGVDAIEITYKSVTDSSIQFKMDYRASDKATLSSASVPFPSTNGVWKTIVLPIAMFEPTPTGESVDQKIESVDWVYNKIAGAYTTNFEPVVLAYIKANGKDSPTVIDNIKGLWYDNLKTVASIAIEPAKTTYYDDEELDLSGTATITYDDGTVASGPMSKYGITYTGFNSKVTEATTQTVTASYGGKTTTFDVNIVTGGKEVASVVLSEDVKAVYLVGDEFDRTSGDITVTLVNGTQTVIPLTDEAVEITGFDSSVQNTNVPVVIKYGDHSFDLRVRVFNPRLEYSAPSFTDGNDAAITSFGGVDTVKANIKVKNRIACDTPQTAVIVAAVYSYGSKVPVVKRLDYSVIPASTELTLSATFTAEELAKATSIKIIALDGAETISNLLTAPAVINK